MSDDWHSTGRHGKGSWGWLNALLSHTKVVLHEAADDLLLKCSVVELASGMLNVTFDY